MSETTRRDRAERISMRMNHASQVDEMIAFADAEVAGVLDALMVQVQVWIKQGYANTWDEPIDRRVLRRVLVLLEKVKRNG